jgi:hypothetical protein
VGESNYQFVSYNTAEYNQEPVIYIAEKDIQDARCLSCTLVIAVYSLDDPGRTVEFEIEVVQRY